MPLKNIAVSKKIGGLVLSIVVMLCATGLGLTSYVSHIEKDSAADIAQYEDRMRMVMEWRGYVQAAGGFLMASSIAQEPQLMSLLQQQTQAMIDQADKEMERARQRIFSDEGRAAFGRIEHAREQLETSVQQVGRLRDAGESLHSFVQSELLPRLRAYDDALNGLVTMQRLWRDRAQARAEAAAQQAVIIGSGLLLIVSILALALATWLVRQFTQPLRMAVELAQSIAGGDLTRNVPADRSDEIGQLLRSLNGMVQKLREIVGEVRGGVESVTAAAGEIAKGNLDLSARTEQTAANLQETAASMEQLTATVTQSAETALQANQLASAAVEAAEHGGKVVQQVVHSMDQINQSSRKINDIIGVIDGIAFQTNILALNAAVEAARAGEQGRGFAVVAGEVRSLAQRSAEAAKEIKALITESVGNVNAGSSQVGQAGESMQAIVESVRRVTDLIGEITASSSEQRDGIEQVNHAVGNLDQMTQQNAALVEESSAAAAAMSEQAQRLSEVVSIFQVGQMNASRRSAAVISNVPIAPVPHVATQAKAHLQVKAMTLPSQSSAVAAPASAPIGQMAAVEGDWENF